MPYVQVNGVDLYYEEYGSGDKIVISAQSNFAEENYQKDLAQVLDGFKVYNITIRGYGKSTHVFEDLGHKWYHIWADDVYQFAKKLEIGKFIYTGVSHGAGIGWNLAFKHPEVIEAFISVVGAPHDRAGGDTSKHRLETIKGIGKENFQGPQFYMVPTNDPVRLERQNKIKQNLKNRFSQMSDEELKIHARKPFPECKTNEQLAEKLSQFKVPTLLLCGCQDDIISAEASLLAAKSVPGAKAVFFQDHSHTLASEAREKMVDEIALFLNQLGLM